MGSNVMFSMISIIVHPFHGQSHHSRVCVYRRAGSLTNSSRVPGRELNRRLTRRHRGNIRQRAMPLNTVPVGLSFTV